MSNAPTMAPTPGKRDTSVMKTSIEQGRLHNRHVDEDEPLPEASPEKPKPTEPERQQWSNKAEFFLVLAGYAIGIGNLWRFPYMVRPSLLLLWSHMTSVGQVGKFGGAPQSSSYLFDLCRRWSLPDRILPVPRPGGRAVVLRRTLTRAAA